MRCSIRKEDRIINGERLQSGHQAESISLLGDRKNNQDRVHVLSDEQRCLLVLADGMGGHTDGALAAQCVVEEAEAVFHQHAELPPVVLMQRIALQAHLNIAGLNPDLGDRQQPRTTVVMLHLDAGRAIFAHAGDSRGYLIRDHKILYKTRDHSAIQNMLDRGEISAEEARKHPIRNQVSRCLGGLSRPTPLEITPCPPVLPGDSFVLSSDGFWEPLSDAEICSEHTLEHLAELALTRNAGRADNTSAIRLYV